MTEKSSFPTHDLRLQPCVSWGMDFYCTRCGFNFFRAWKDDLGDPPPDDQWVPLVNRIRDECAVLDAPREPRERREPAILSWWHETCEKVYLQGGDVTELTITGWSRKDISEYVLGGNTRLVITSLVNETTGDTLNFAVGDRDYLTAEFVHV